MPEHAPEVTHPRHARVLELVRERGFCSIEELARTFEVTPQTVRRDVRSLCERGLLRRHHGGVGLPSSVENVDYRDRRVQYLAEKRRIARAVAAEIPHHASLFINIGTTTEEVARALAYHRGLRVITNNLNVAAILAGKEDFEVIVAGGVVRSRDRGITGEATVDLISQFKVDVGVIGISGIDEDGALLDFDYHEVRVARAIVENSRKVWLVTDHSKFGREALVRMGHLSQIDALFTDREPPRAWAGVIEAARVTVHVAPAG